MQCVHPRLIKNPAWDMTKDTPESFTVPCGVCVGCRIARTREWSVRLYHELPYHDDAVFLTLTYDEDHLPFDGGLHKDHLQKFFKRLRKDVDHPIKAFSCGEYGENTHRPHYHSIIFGLSAKDRYLFDKHWKYGFNTVGSVSYDSIRYVCGYVQKKLYGKEAKRYLDREPPFMSCSKHLGAKYCLDNAERLKETMKVTVRGVELSLPRYYRKLLGIDTLDYFESTQDYREQVDDILLKRIPDCPPQYKEYFLLDERHKAQVQYEKDMKASLSLKERNKC